jgi:hypothetical protein
MPKAIAQVIKEGKVGVKRVGGKKLDFAPILATIITSGKAYTVKDVHEGANLVNKRLSRQRVYKLMNQAVEDKQLFKMTMDDGDNYFDYVKRPK